MRLCHQCKYQYKYYNDADTYVAKCFELFLSILEYKCDLFGCTEQQTGDIFRDVFNVRLFFHRLQPSKSIPIIDRNGEALRVQVLFVCDARRLYRPRISSLFLAST